MPSVRLPGVSVVVLSTSGPGASAAASKSSILRSNAVSCVSITDAVLSPLKARRGSRVSRMEIYDAGEEDWFMMGGFWWEGRSILC